MKYWRAEREAVLDLKIRKRILEIDNKMSEEAVPVGDRPLRLGRLIGQEVPWTLELQQYVENWYACIYGSKVNTLGKPRIKVPIILRGEVYMLRIPQHRGCVYVTADSGDMHKEHPTILVPNYIEELTVALWERLLSPNLKNDICWSFQIAFELALEIEKVKGETFGNLDVTNLINRALCDYEVAYNSAAIYLNNNCSFQASQAAEKFMKAVLVYKKVCTFKQVKEIRHDLEKLRQECATVDNEFDRDVVIKSISSLVSLGNPSSRYGQDLSIKDAVDASWGALKIMGPAACQLVDGSRILQEHLRDR